MQLYKMNEIEQQMHEDLRWASTAPEVQQHEGLLVAAYKKQVLGAGRDRDTLVAEAAAKGGCPWHDIVVVVVPRATLDDDRGPDLDVAFFEE